MIAPEVKTVNLIVTCSSRKSRRSDPIRLVRNLLEETTRTRGGLWVDTLSLSPQSCCTPASEMYQGEHWSVVRKLIAWRTRNKDWQTRVWIASAGCALISPETRIPAYGATFAPRDPDSVGSTSIERREWWRVVSQGLSDGRGGTRSILDLARRFPDDPILVAASPEYLDAMADDLASAREALTRESFLTILCRRGTLPGWLESSKVYLSADLSSSLGGTLTSLNARVLLWLLRVDAQSFARSSVADLISQLQAESRPRPLHNRERATDEEILAHIRQCLAADRRVSGSRALRKFRDAGRAAEQKRFQHLFRTASQELSNA